MATRDVTVLGVPARATARAPAPTVVITEESVDYNWKVIGLLALATLAASAEGLLVDGRLGIMLGLIFSMAKFALGGRARIRVRTIRRIEP
jgi:hypothetical protein